MIWNYKKRLNDDTIVKIIGVIACLAIGLSIGYLLGQAKVNKVDPNARPYYITLDDTGAWLGDSPGHKFYPLYDSQGQRLGGKVHNDSTTGTE